MSFSAQVKEELYSRDMPAMHCMAAELSAYINMCGELSLDEGEELVMLHNESTRLLERAARLINELFGFSPTINRYILTVGEARQAREIINALGLRSRFNFNADGYINSKIVSKTCCKRAYIRGAFLCSGSVTDPSKQYHMELVNGDYEHAEELRELLESFGVEAKIIERKGHFVVYLKDAEQVVDVLNIIEAHRALLELENLRIVKEMRNNVNRAVNCETANIKKVVAAGVEQIEAIRTIEEKQGLRSLPPALRQMAELRLEYPDASLKELGELLTPTIGKSGVNHRLKRICEISAKLKGDY